MNDSELRIARVDGDVADIVAQSTGFAMIDDRAIRFGERAMQQFRLHPRQVNNQFWNRLNTDPLAVRGPDTANNADLVYRHVRRTGSRGGVRSRMTNSSSQRPAPRRTNSWDCCSASLAEAGITVTGLVDNALAASILHPSPKRVLHVDVFLHRVVVTEMTKTDGLARQRVEEIAELGFTNLLDAWVNVIADRFVRDARFDPLSIATTDQQLYNQLLHWLRDPARPREFGIDVDLRGSLRRAELNDEALIDKVTPRYRMLDRHSDGATVFLSHRAARLPGLPAHLAGSAARVVTLDAHGSVPRHRVASDVDPLRSKSPAPRHAPARATDRRRGTRSPAATANRAASATGAPHTRSVGQRCGCDRSNTDARSRAISRTSRRLSARRACRSSLGAMRVQLKLIDGMRRDARRRRRAQRRNAQQRIDARSSAASGFSLIRTRSGP